MADRTNSHEDGNGGELRPVETDPTGTYSRVRYRRLLSMIWHAPGNQAVRVWGVTIALLTV